MLIGSNVSRVYQNVILNIKFRFNNFCLLFPNFKNKLLTNGKEILINLE